MTNKTNAAKTEVPAVENNKPHDTDNVDQIRDILFGKQIRDFDVKFKRLEDKVSQEIENLKKDSNLRFQTLESFIKSELESLDKRINTEHKGRVNDIESLTSEMQKNVKSLENKLSEQENQANSNHRELRQLILDQSNEFLEKMNNKYIEAKQMLDNINQDLSREKVSKNTLSTMLTDLALKIAETDSNDKT